MSEYVAIAGLVLQAFGTVSQGNQNEGIAKAQGKAASDQGFADEQAQRREGRQVMGRQAAAMAEAGGGVDEGVVKQSAVAAELDALNIRYGGLLQRQGLKLSSKNNSKLLAGSQLLMGGSKLYASRV
jgi:hypothetical protein